MPVPSGYTLVYGEEFDGSSLPSPWQLGYYFSNPVPSGQVTVSGGALHLNWQRGSANDISVSSTQTFHYGYFEVRMKWTVSPGAWPAFWFIPTNGAGDTGEIDVFEGQGNDSQAFFATLHEWIGSQQKWFSDPNRFPVSVDFSQYHTYGLLWEPGGVFTWYLDNSIIHTISVPDHPIFDTQSVFPILSMQMGNNWTVGNLSGVSVDSLTNDIDYFRAYQNGGTSSTGTGGGGTSGSGSGTGGGTDPTTGGASGGGVTVPPPVPDIISYTASPASISIPGDPVILTLNVTGATSMTVNGVPVTGTTLTVNPTTTTAYELVATNGAGTTTALVVIPVAGEGRYPFRYFQTNIIDREGDGNRFQMFGGGNPQQYEMAMYNGGRNVIPSGARGLNKGDWILFGGSGWGTLPVAADGYIATVDSASILGVKWQSAASILGNGQLDATVGDAFWGQVPRGSVNGVNQTYLTDYKLASPFTVLQLNMSALVPTKDSDTGADNPDGQYTITMDGVITINFAPATGDKLYINYIRNRATTVPVSSASVYAVTEHIPSAGSAAWGGGISTAGVGLFFPHTDWVESNAAWGKRTDSKSIDPAGIGDLFVLLMNYREGSPTVGPYDPPDELRVYDVYAIITYADSSTRTFRPTATAINPDPGSTGQQVLNPGNAIDGDPATYATILASTYAAGLSGVYLNVNSFALVP